MNKFLKVNNFFKYLIQVLSAFVCLIFYFFYDISIYLFYTWTINILIFFVVKKFSFDNKFLKLLKSNCYFVQYIIFFIIFDSYRGYMSWNIFYLFGSLIIVSIFYFFNYNKCRIMLSSIIIDGSNIKISVNRCINLVYINVGAAICEELYFRVVLLGIFKPFEFASIFIVTLYFVIYHYMFSVDRYLMINDYLNQIFIGFFMTTIFYFSNNVYYSIFIHFMINFINCLFYFKHIIKNIKNKKHEKHVTCEDYFDDIVL